ncbi:hypothetical protein P5668_00045 (plasmid) [Bacillus subtilis]|nr:hypothetical protein D9C10_22675 [Bacillus subtilis subsp. subtilis]WGD66075.1 hypothetical protein P5652_22575 [Bacillus subtilis]WGD72701.1 hypothetical protein P5668_00045 [Bacillus subtilis]
MRVLAVPHCTKKNGLVSATKTGSYNKLINDTSKFLLTDTLLVGDFRNTTGHAKILLIQSIYNQCILHDSNSLSLWCYSILTIIYRNEYNDEKERKIKKIEDAGNISDLQ